MKRISACVATILVKLAESARGQFIIHITRSGRSLLQLVLVVSLLITSANSVVMADTIAYWSGNGNANDSIGGHNGTLVGGATYGAGRLGGEQAFQLNGSNGYVSVPDSTAWDFGANSFRIDVWANFNSISSRSFAQTGNVLIGHDDGPGATNKWFFSYLSTGQLGFHINSSPGGPADFLTSPIAAPVNTGDWNEFSVTRIGSTYTFYENGISLGSATDANYSSIPIATHSLTIGQAEGAGWFNGRLEDIQISSPAAVPEPSTLVLAGIGFAIGAYRRRRMSASEQNAIDDCEPKPLVMGWLW